jgi:hypothetical protein
MAKLDDKVMLFANPEDGAEILGYDLPEEEDEPQLPG